ncbi:MAG: protein tyrosine phosphatase family protein [Syntrophothermus sp.]
MFEDIYNFMPLSETLFSGGMPSAEQLQDGTEHGVNVVINLAPHDAPGALPEEEKLVRSLGMEYINIPVTWNTPTEEDLKKFMTVMQEHRHQTVLVHCQANFRASAFIAMYRILRLGWDPEDALQVMHKIWDEQEYPVWRTFIEDMLHKSRNEP